MALFQNISPSIRNYILFDNPLDPQGALAPNLFPDQENMSFSHKPYHILVKQAAGITCI